MALIFTTGCSTKPHVVRQTTISVAAARKIYVISHGWHTGFAVPTATLFSRVPELQSRFGMVPYVEFGWGDRGFYQAEEITSGLTLMAILWPTQSVIHAVAVPTRPDIYFSGSEVISLCLEAKQYSLLISFIEKSFLRDREEIITPLSRGIYGNSQFYVGEGDYFLFNTCNKWTAKGLKSAELDIQPTFTLTADSIMEFLAEYTATMTNNHCVTIDVSPTPQL